MQKAKALWQFGAFKMNNVTAELPRLLTHMAHYHKTLPSRWGCFPMNSFALNLYMFYGVWCTASELYYYSEALETSC